MSGLSQTLNLYSSTCSHGGGGIMAGDSAASEHWSH